MPFTKVNSISILFNTKFYIIDKNVLSQFLVLRSEIVTERKHEKSVFLEPALETKFLLHYYTVLKDKRLHTVDHLIERTKRLNRRKK